MRRNPKVWDINICSLPLVLSMKIRRTGNEERHRTVPTAGTPIFSRTGCRLGATSIVNFNMTHPGLPRSLVSFAHQNSQISGDG